MTTIQILGVLLDSPIFMAGSSLFAAACGYRLAKRLAPARVARAAMLLAGIGGAIGFWAFYELLEPAMTDKDALRVFQATLMAGAYLLAVAIGLLGRRALETVSER
jgi:hypothetical protein